MAAPSLEQLFVRFRTSRDPKPLAAIFDATAAELLLVAVHLVGDRAEAEDLVQATFVAVIEGADGYDASRPLRPWLVGVLVHRAKLALRRRRTRAAQDIAGLEVPSRDADPSELARAEETAGRIARALEGMPSPYRQVLVLHLLHGLRGVQIAHALGRPPATVRTQLKRGLSMLRDALPLALAVPMALLATEGRGLAAVRTAVLEHAAATTTAATGIAAGATAVAALAGGMVMGKKILLGAAALSAGAVFVVGTAQFAPGDPPQVETAEPAAEPRRAAVDHGTAVVSGAPAMLREVVEVRAVTPVRTLVRGRIVGAWDGAPKVADRVGVTARPADDDVTKRRPVEEWVTSAGADGRFEVEVAFAPERAWSLSLRGPAFTYTYGAIPLAAPGEHDLGDIEVQRGTWLRGRVIDEAGEPMADVPFEIECPFATLTGVSRGVTGVTSDAAGLLEHDGRLRAGEVELTARSGHTIVRGGRFRIEAGAEIAEPTIVVRKLGDEESISGRVEDRRGRGIRNIGIHVGYRHRASTRRDGTFRLFKEPGDVAWTSLSFVGTDAFVGRAHESVRFGTHDLRIVLEDAVTVPLRVVGADTGEPIESFAVHFGGTDDPMFQRDDLAKHWRTGTHEDGRVDLTGLPRTGRLALIVLPEGDAHAMSEQLAVDLPWRSNEPLVVRLRPRQPVAVRVVGADRQPVPGATVQLVQTNPGDDIESQNFGFVTARSAWHRLLPQNDAGWPAAFSIDEATTDEAGVAHLSCALPSTDVAVVITGDAIRTLRVRPIDLGPEPTDVVVQSGATVRGRIGPRDIVQRFRLSVDDPSASYRLAIGLRRPGGALVNPHPTSWGNPIDAEGGFAIHGLAPGAWELFLLWTRPLSASSSQQFVCEPALRTVQLASGEPLDLGELDLTPHAPATIRGRVFHAGAPVPHGTITLTRRHTDASGRELEEPNLGGVPSDGDGRFALSGLLPGTYTLHLEQLDTAGSRRTMQSEEFVLARGTALDRVFELR